MREYSADADGIVVSPMHASLLAPSGDQDSCGGFDMPGSDEEAFLSELSIVHILLTLPDVIESLFGILRGAQRLCVFVFESFDDGSGTAPIK